MYSCIYIYTHLLTYIYIYILSMYNLYTYTNDVLSMTAADRASNSSLTIASLIYQSVNIIYRDECYIYKERCVIYIYIYPAIHILIYIYFFIFMYICIYIYICIDDLVSTITY